MMGALPAAFNKISTENNKNKDFFYRYLIPNLLFMISAGFVSGFKDKFSTPSEESGAFSSDIFIASLGFFLN
jgi:hypothetical protein